MPCQACMGDPSDVSSLQLCASWRSWTIGAPDAPTLSLRSFNNLQDISILLSASLQAWPSSVAHLVTQLRSCFHLLKFLMVHNKYTIIQSSFGLYYRLYSFVKWIQVLDQNEEEKAHENSLDYSHQCCPEPSYLHFFVAPKVWMPNSKHLQYSGHPCFKDIRQPESMDSFTAGLFLDWLVATCAFKACPRQISSSVWFLHAFCGVIGNIYIYTHIHIGLCFSCFLVVS